MPGLLALVAIQVLIGTESRKEPRYEYKVLVMQSEGMDRTGETAMKFASVTPSEKELSKLGDASLEAVGTYPEMETAYPNCDKAEYVTEFQPKVRP